MKCDAHAFLALISIVFTASFCGPASAFDAAAAEALARREHCFKCHAIDKSKEGPAFSKVAAKYRGRDDGQAQLLRHLTSGELVLLASGEEEQHRIIKEQDETKALESGCLDPVAGTLNRILFFNYEKHDVVPDIE